MRKLADTLLLCVLFGASLMGFALADVAVGPSVGTLIAVPLIIVAVLVVVIVLVVKAVRNRTAKIIAEGTAKDAEKAAAAKTAETGAAEEPSVPEKPAEK